MEGAIDDVELLVFGELQEVDGVARDADDDGAVVVLVGVFVGVEEAGFVDDVDVAVVEVGFGHGIEDFDQLLFGASEGLGDDGDGERDAVETVGEGDFGEAGHGGDDAVLVFAVRGVGAGSERFARTSSCSYTVHYCIRVRTGSACEPGAVGEGAGGGTVGDVGGDGEEGEGWVGLAVDFAVFVMAH